MEIENSPSIDLCDSNCENTNGNCGEKKVQFSRLIDRFAVQNKLSKPKFIGIETELIADNSNDNDGFINKLRRLPDHGKIVNPFFNQVDNNKNDNIIKSDQLIEDKEKIESPSSPKSLIIVEDKPIKCLRTDCSNRAIQHPDWDFDYCSAKCVVQHVKNSFSNFFSTLPTE